MAKPTIGSRERVLRQGSLSEVLNLITDQPFQESFDPSEIKLALLNLITKVIELEKRLDRENPQ